MRFTRDYREMNADSFVKTFAKKAIGMEIQTEAIGEYPGGKAIVTELYPDPECPKIVCNVKHPTFGEIGIFSDETVGIKS